MAFSLTKFWRKVKMPDNMENCWLWPTVNSSGYGKLTIEGESFGAHRVSWMLTNREIIPWGMCICHKCDTPNCINPMHLFLGTTQDNTTDKVNKNRQARGAKIVDGQPTKITAEDVLEIRRLRSEGMKLVDISTRFGISYSHAGSVARGDFWSHINADHN